MPINKIKNILKDEAFIRMNQSTLKGYLGELYVKQKLEAEGFEIEHKGNQSNVDLIIHKHQLFIDVKLSSKKFQKNISSGLWTFALRQSSKNKIKCTHFVCVALNEAFDVVSYYIVRANDLDKIPGPLDSRFSKVLNTLALAENLEDFLGNEVLTKCHMLLQDNIVRRVLPNDNLSALLTD